MGFWQRLITPFCVRRLEFRNLSGGLFYYSYYYVFGIRVAAVGKWV